MYMYVFPRKLLRITFQCLGLNSIWKELSVKKFVTSLSKGQWFSLFYHHDHFRSDHFAISERILITTELVLVKG